MNRKLYPWIPAVVYMLTIFVQSSFPAPRQAELIPTILDIKIVHVVEYGILCLLYSYALNKTFRLNSVQLFWIPVILAVVYGVTDELHQAFVPERTCKISDIVSNTIGAIGFQSLNMIIRASSNAQNAPV